MKVILLGATPPPVGGIAQWTVRMLNSQLKNGWEIDFIDEKILGGRECFGSNVRKNYFYELKRWWRIWSTLRKKVKNPEAKVVHACPIASKSSMLAEYVSATITKRYKKRFVIHFRCTVPNMIKSSLDRFLLRLFCNKSDQIIALNSQTKKYLETITDTPVVVIPNFVEVSEINEQKRIAGEVKTVLYVGGVIKEKGCEDILEVAKNFPEIEFRLVGRASEDIERMSLGLSNVTLVGVKSKSEVKEELQNADIFMFLSQYSGEGFSNALAEAMAAGLPCIVTDWAANADMIEDGKGGKVVPCHDLEKTYEAMKGMLPSEVRKKCSDFNCKKVKNCYSEDGILEQYVGCYEMCLVSE